MGTFSYIVLVAFSAFIIKKFMIDPEIELQRTIKRTKERKESKEEIAIPKKKKEDDFYGTDLMIEDPRKFMAEVAQKKKELDNGENVGVNAAQAMFLIRNARHHDLIVGENGVINFVI